MIIKFMRTITLLSLFLYLQCYAQPDDKKSSTETKSAPLVGILVDVSLHQKKVFDFEREAVNSLLGYLEGMAAEGYIIKYGDKVQLLQDWSPLKDRDDKILPRIELDTEIRKYERTLLNDALYIGIRKLKSKFDSPSKVLIVIGEGNDSGSSTRYAQIKALARSANIQCFALLVADHNLMGARVRHFGFYLYDLARTTKGAGYDIEDSHKHLDKAVRNVLERIRLFQNSLSTPDRQR